MPPKENKTADKKAYQAQYRYACDFYSRPRRRALLNQLSKGLSSALYGNLESI